MNLEVDPAQLKCAAAELSLLRDRVQRVFDDLRSDLASRRTSWEHGTFGTAFAGGAHGYLAAKDQLFQSAHNLATSIGQYSFALSTAADAWALAEDEPAAGNGGR